MEDLSVIQESLYIIKPEVFDKRHEIRKHIEEIGLVIQHEAILVLPRSIIEGLYPSVVGELLAASIKFLACGPSAVGIVKGSNAVNRLLWLGGGSTNPALCAEYTIRFRFGIHKPALYGTATYYLNGFHRSVNVLEAQRDIVLFAPLFKGDTK